MNTKNNSIPLNKENRNYGIDLLRIFSMFLITLLHSLGHGGILNNVKLGSVQYSVTWMIDIFAFCAVDIFALITGYVYYSDDNKKIKYSNYIKLWFEVIFYNLLITILYGIINKQCLDFKTIFNCFLPLYKNSYWYFTAYTGLFFLIPIINAGIRNTENSKLKKYFMIIFILFSVFDTVLKRFNLQVGYSVIWLIILYIMGAIIKKCEIGKNIKTYQALLIIWFLGIITFVFFKFGFETELIKNDVFISYTSPTVLGMAIFYLIGFSKIKFSNGLIKIIKFTSSSAFALYLINDNILIRENYIKNIFINIVNDPVIIIIIHLLLFSIMFISLSLIIDKIRIIIFKLLGINKLCDKIENLGCLILKKKK